jgi:hypothetical protein
LARELPTVSLYNRSGGHGQTLFGNKVIGSQARPAKKLSKTTMSKRTREQSASLFIDDQAEVSDNDEESLSGFIVNDKPPKKKRQRFQ